MPTSELVDPAVRVFMEALNANDPEAVKAAMAGNATMTDDGTPRQPDQWLEREAFDENGRMGATQQSPDGLDLLVDLPARLPPPRQGAASRPRLALRHGPGLTGATRMAGAAMSGPWYVATTDMGSVMRAL